MGDTDGDGDFDELVSFGAVLSPFGMETLEKLYSTVK
jgi:hypothetical protein